MSNFHRSHRYYSKFFHLFFQLLVCEYDDKIAAARKEKEAAIDGQDFEKAASLRDKEKSLITEKADKAKNWKAGDLDVVADVVFPVVGNATNA